MTAGLIHFFEPHFSANAAAFLRICYGVLLFLQLALTATQVRRFFVSERYGGYVESSRFADTWQRPAILVAVMALWLLAACGLLFNVGTLACAALNCVLARYFFVNTRWKSILRGMGAPGHMNSWIATLVFLLEFAAVFDRTGWLRNTTVFAFRVDFALIMISAGIYKVTAGYTKNEGMERGLVNPYWGFFAHLYNRLPPRDPVFRILNHLAYLTEICCGVAMLFAPIAPWGALALGLSFVFIGLNIRLTFLAEMVTVCCILFVNAGDVFDRMISSVVHLTPATPLNSPAGAAVCAAFTGVLCVYLVMLLPSYFVMYVNFYGRTRFAPRVQRMFDWWTRTFGLIIWRVFTIDVTNFYVRVLIEDAATGARRQYYRMKAFDRASGWRYMHVGEFILLASLFTTLKYYPDNPALFERRVTRYARTIPLQAGERVVFDYVAIEKAATYVHRTVREYIYDPNAGTLQERVIDPAFDVRSGASVSPVHAGSVPGTYAPPARIKLS